MLLLKRFGDSALSYLKKIKEHVRELEKQLHFALFIQPVVALFLSFITLILMTNLFLYYFIDSQVDQRIKQQFLYLDQRYGQQNNYSIEQNNLFQATYLILDKNLNVQYHSNSIDDEAAKDNNESILNLLKNKNMIKQIIKENNNATEKSDAHSFTIEDDHYYLDIKEYQGILKDYYIKASASGEKYTVVTYVRTTPLTHFIIMINCMLILLSLLIGLFTWRRQYLISLNLSRSFEQIENNLIDAGNRQLKLPMKILDYNEFNTMQTTIKQMDGQISESENKQKLFFQNASHELRTPLMSIQGYAESISNNIIDDPKQAADIISAESGKMKKLVNEILLLSKLGNKDSLIEFETISLTDLVYDVTWPFQAQAEKRGIKFTHNFEKSYTEIYANEDYLKTAISNIIMNALRYATSQITISIKVLQNATILSIANDGQAISSEDLPHIFERFYKGKDGQTGIGLAVAKEIIEKHQGDISVKSTEEETQFIILLPRNK